MIQTKVVHTNAVCLDCYTADVVPVVPDVQVWATAWHGSSSKLVTMLSYAGMWHRSAIKLGTRLLMLGTRTAAAHFQVHRP